MSANAGGTRHTSPVVATAQPTAKRKNCSNDNFFLLAVGWAVDQMTLRLMTQSLLPRKSVLMARSKLQEMATSLQARARYHPYVIVK